MLFFLLKSQDKVETLEPEALVMFISRTYFFLTAEIILIYVILEITFWSGSSDFNWYLYIHVYWDSLSMQMFLTFISFSFRFIFLFLSRYMTYRYSLFNCHIFAHTGQFMNLLFTTFHQKLNKKGRNKNSYYQ